MWLGWYLFCIIIYACDCSNSVNFITNRILCGFCFFGSFMWNRSYKNEMISALSVPTRPLPLSISQNDSYLCDDLLPQPVSDIDTLQGLAAGGIPVEIPYPYEYGTDPNVFVQQIEQNVIDVEQNVAGLISGMAKVANGEIGQLYSRISYDYLIRNMYTDQ